MPVFALRCVRLCALRLCALRLFVSGRCYTSFLVSLSLSLCLSFSLPKYMDLRMYTCARTLAGACRRRSCERRGRGAPSWHAHCLVQWSAFLLAAPRFLSLSLFSLSLLSLFLSFSLSALVSSCSLYVLHQPMLARAKMMRVLLWVMDIHSQTLIRGSADAA